MFLGWSAGSEFSSNRSLSLEKLAGYEKMLEAVPSLG